MSVKVPLCVILDVQYVIYLCNVNTRAGLLSYLLPTNYVVRGKVMFLPVSVILFRGGRGWGTSCPGPVQWEGMGVGYPN